MVNVLLYAHDGVGYGHIARMANLASSIQQHSSEAVIHFVSGYHNIYNFFSEEITLIHHKLPRLLRGQEINEQYELSEQLKRERAEMLKSIFLDARYDFIIIDFFAFGSGGELVELLQTIRRQYSHTKIILTQRGVAFSKEKTLRFFNENNGIKYINTVYNAIICFCDPRIIDLNEEYFEGHIQIPIFYCGYIYQPDRYILRDSRRTGINILIDFGGGHNCDELLMKILNELDPKTSGHDKITILLGEYFQQSARDHILSNCNFRSCISVLSNSFSKSTRAIETDIVISCGGYNVMVDSVLNNIPVIVIPKDASAEASIHSKRIASYSSLGIINPEQIYELWPLIQKMAKIKTSHNLLTCKARSLVQLLNNKHESINNNIAC